MGHGAVDVARRQGEQGNPSSALAEIVVPDAYSSFVRLLLFLYTGEKKQLSQYLRAFFHIVLF